MALGVTLEELRTEAWWIFRARRQESCGQAIGRAAHACRIQALLAASAHSMNYGLNVIVLPDHIAPPSFVRIHRR